MSEADARRALQTLKIELAVIQEELAGPRMAWRAFMDAMKARCLTLDNMNERIVSWRAPTRSDAAEMDAARAQYLSDVGDMPERERVLKAAIREAEIDLKSALKAGKAEPASRQKTTENPRSAGQMELF